jgi:hypothetical protein
MSMTMVFSASVTSMDTSRFTRLSETAQVLLGAFALADVHTLTADEVQTMSGGAIAAEAAALALAELADSELAESQLLDSVTAYRLTKSGLELSLQLQSALQQRGGAD